MSQHGPLKNATTAWRMDGEGSIRNVCLKQRCVTKEPQAKEPQAPPVKVTFKQGVEAGVCNPRFERQEAQRFKVLLPYIVSSWVS